MGNPLLIGVKYGLHLTDANVQSKHYASAKYGIYGSR